MGSEPSRRSITAAKIRKREKGKAKEEISKMSKKIRFGQRALGDNGLISFACFLSCFQDR